MGACDRHEARYFIREQQRKREEIHKLISAFSGLNTKSGWHRGIILDMFEKAYIYRRVVANSEDAGIVTKYKDKIRRTIIGARGLRMAGGNPLAFSDYEHDFWFDPSTNYIPEEQLELARKEIDFHVMTMKITTGQYYGIMRVHQRRGHSGRWTGIDNLNDSAGAAYNRKPGEPDTTPRPHQFYFESATDFIEFRLMYEHELVE